jgi:hypothetical protein
MARWFGTRDHAVWVERHSHSCNPRNVKRRSAGHKCNEIVITGNSQAFI